MQPNKPLRKNQPSVHKSKPTSNVQKISIWMLAVSLAMTLFSYLPALEADFINWDDDEYVINNETIRNISSNEWITTPVQGNYHPLTMLTLAVNYKFSGEKAHGYHLLNLLLHLLNVFLVFKLAFRLGNGNNIIAFASALLFGIHPMHVESVAWISERKDVLYTFFFLLGLISYLKYADSQLRKYYVFCILWFVLSLLSKPAAIIFPVALFAIDFFRKRKFNSGLIIEKIPFFVLSAAMVWLTLHGQENAGATEKSGMYSMGSRFFFPFYGYMMYFIRMIIPINLAAFYPFPPINKSLPAEYLIAPVFFIATVILAFVYRKKFPVVAFGFGFYFITLILVLQFYIIGSAVIADRYTYLPYLGLFFLFGWWLDYKFRQKQSTAVSILLAIGIIFSVVTYQQAGTWKNSAAVWDNAIEKQPSYRAYLQRGKEYRKQGQLEKALDSYNKALSLNVAEKDIYNSRANVYFDMKNDSLALLDYQKALQMDPACVTCLSNRSMIYFRRGEFDLAVADMNRVIQLKPDFKRVYKNRGFTLMNLGQFEDAKRDLEKFLTYEPDDAETYNGMGLCYYSLQQYDKSVEAYTRAISLQSSPMFFLNRSKSLLKLGRIDEARNDASVARKGGMELPPELFSL